MGGSFGEVGFGNRLLVGRRRQRGGTGLIGVSDRFPLYESADRRGRNYDGGTKFFGAHRNRHLTSFYSTTDGGSISPSAVSLPDDLFGQVGGGSYVDSLLADYEFNGRRCAVPYRSTPLFYWQRRRGEAGPTRPRTAIWSEFD